MPVRWLVKRKTQFYTIQNGKRQIQTKMLVTNQVKTLTKKLIQLDEMLEGPSVDCYTGPDQFAPLLKGLVDD